MKRILWLIVGILVGVYAVTRLKKRAQQFAPEGLQQSAEKMASAIRHFGDEVRAGMAERETELRDALGIENTNDREDYR